MTKNNTIRILRIESEKNEHTHAHKSHNHAQMTLFRLLQKSPHPPHSTETLFKVLFLLSPSSLYKKNSQQNNEADLTDGITPFPRPLLLIPFPNQKKKKKTNKAIRGDIVIKMC